MFRDTGLFGDMFDFNKDGKLDDNEWIAQMLFLDQVDEYTKRSMKDDPYEDSDENFGENPDDDFDNDSDNY